ncbi:heat shock protein Hsp-12.2-like [Amphibalanus amphitrite]|uniref:heat shock protein Hsp-12.2-like n=1 Tax=Amphibalanus amphitrite TaxID=1232801 RepID=UPI001C8FFC6D|nr:heat shock protein Hsp-12.2-like [Amphibalanus amphitrite]XP_043206085.1 heat shock protein Hsp-12.2-like [Amphibalanus amphitrite]XP_043206094.1 heat shock protein Hsp-12.2-like [Amphibalanus amphitrite]
MSVPLYFDDPFFDDALRDFGRHRSPRMFDQHFGMGVPRRPLMDDYLPAVSSRRYASRAPVVLHRQNSGTSEITSHKDRVEMRLDVQHFLPEELKVKIVDGMVVVEAKHEEKRDEHGSVARQFTRKYELPEDADEDGVVSHLSKEGVLTITAPRKCPQQPDRPEKTVPLKVDRDGK